MSCETKLRIAGDPATYGELDDNAVTADGISIEALSGDQVNASNIVAGRIHLSPHLEEGLLKIAVVALEEIARSAGGAEAARALAALHEMHNLVVTCRDVEIEDRRGSGTKPATQEDLDRHEKHGAEASSYMEPGAIQNRKILEDPAIKAFWEARIRENVRAYEKAYGNKTDKGKGA